MDVPLWCLGTETIPFPQTDIPVRGYNFHLSCAFRVGFLSPGYHRMISQEYSHGQEYLGRQRMIWLHAVLTRHRLAGSRSSFPALCSPSELWAGLFGTWGAVALQLAAFFLAAVSAPSRDTWCALIKQLWIALSRYQLELSIDQRMKIQTFISYFCCPESAGLLLNHFSINLENG